MATMTMSTPVSLVTPVRATAASPRRATSSVAGVTSTSTRGRPSHRPVRLTRRGRLLVVVVLVGVAFVLLSAGRGAATGATAVSSGPVTARVVVAPGETLWSIASEVAPGADPRETIVRIRELNPGLASAPTGTLIAGQPLIVPAR